MGQDPEYRRFRTPLLQLAFVLLAAALSMHMSCDRAGSSAGPGGVAAVHVK